MENEDGGWMSIKREEVAELIQENEDLRAENKHLRELLKKYELEN